MIYQPLKIKNFILFLTLVIILTVSSGCSLINSPNHKIDNAQNKNVVVIGNDNTDKVNLKDEIDLKSNNELKQADEKKQPDVTPKIIYKTYKVRALPPSNEVYELKIEIPNNRYNYYKNNDLGHGFNQAADIAFWATPEEPILKEIAEELRSLGEKNKNFYFINSVFEIIKNIKYVSDYTKDEIGEYWNFPIETLVEGKGDCEDMSFLTAGLFGAIGWDVILTGLPGHMAMAIEMPDVVMKALYNTDYIPFDYYDYQGKKYYYIETTNLNDFKISQIPADYKDVIPDFYSVTNQDFTNKDLSIPIAEIAQWKIFISVEDGFKILLPSRPQKKTNYYRTAKYNTYKICASDVCYLVSVSGTKSDNGFVPTIEQVSEMALINQPNSTLISIEKTILNGYPAYDIIIKNHNNNVYSKEKNIYVNGLFYKLGASYLNNDCEKNNCNQFFGSFELLK